MPKLLVVDDDAGLLQLTQTILGDDGYTVDTAANGAEALAILKSDAYDLVISDVYMPVMSGIDLLTHCRQTFPGLPFIIMSGGDDLGQLDALARAGIMGAQETLYKPFNKADLLGAIQRCLHPKAV